MDSTRKNRSDTGKLFDFDRAPVQRNSIVFFYGANGKEHSAHGFVQALLAQVEALPKPMPRPKWERMTVNDRSDYMRENGLKIIDGHSIINNRIYVEFERLPPIGGFSEHSPRYDKDGRRLI